MKKRFAPSTDKPTELEMRNARLVRQLAGECMVVLENDGVLPFAGDIHRIALYGNGARHTVKGGSGSGDVNVRENVSVEQGLLAAGYEIVTGPWLDHYDSFVVAAKEKFMAAYEKAKEANGGLSMGECFTNTRMPEIGAHDFDLPFADAAVYVLSRNSGEGYDRRCIPGDYLLDETELAAIKAVSEHYEKFVLLLNTGGVIDLSNIVKLPGINAILLIGQSGNMGGHAVADVLTGVTVPSGKLTDTWAANYMDYPCADEYGHRNGDLDDEYYREGIYVGYRWFDTLGIEPLYCFGYGKGYTEFSRKVMSASLNGTLLTVTATVKNEGARCAGREVLQLYVTAPSGRLSRPYQELKAFAKSSLLEPGAAEELTLSCDVRDFAAYDTQSASWVLESGDYIIRVGASSRDTDPAALVHVPCERVVRRLRDLFSDPDPVRELEIERKHPGAAAPKGISVLRMDPSEIITQTVEYTDTRPVYQDETPWVHLRFADVEQGNATLEALVAQLSNEELASLCIGSFNMTGDPSLIGTASETVPGAAGETTGLLNERRGIPKLIMADGPAGLRLYPHFKTDRDGNLLPGGSVFGMEVEPFPENLPDGTLDFYQYCTAIPVASTLAQSWDEELLQIIGNAVREEMALLGVDLWLAPALNIHRNPLCGRNFEYFSEDPLLSGHCAAAVVRGVQRTGRQGVVIKHLAANNQEDNRLFNNSHVSVRALREIYLKAFEITLERSEPFSIMSSYNLINGVHSANNHDLLQSVARDEWGFQGAVMTDWFSTQDIESWGFIPGKYPRAYADACVAAGNDLQMPGGQSNLKELLDAVRTGEITCADLQYCALHVLKLIYKLKAAEMPEKGEQK